MATIEFQVKSYELSMVSHDFDAGGPPSVWYVLTIQSVPQAHGITSKAVLNFIDKEEFADQGAGGTVKPDDVFHFTFSLALPKEDFAALHGVLSTEKPVRCLYVTDVHPFSPVSVPTKVSVQLFRLFTGDEPVGEGEPAGPGRATAGLGLKPS